jgi:hypothetical protein
MTPAPGVALARTPTLIWVGPLPPPSADDAIEESAPCLTRKGADRAPVEA